MTQELVWKKYKQSREAMKKLPKLHNAEETLEIYRRMYSYLKRFHNDLPKPRKNMFRIANDKCRKRFNARGIAHSHPDRKQVCLSKNILERQADATDILGDDNWTIHSGTMQIAELMTHEITHWHIKGSHNKKFYERQKRLFLTLLNGIISGKYYSESPLV